MNRKKVKFVNGWIHTGARLYNREQFQATVQAAYVVGATDEAVLFLESHFTTGTTEISICLVDIGSGICAVVISNQLRTIRVGRTAFHVGLATRTFCTTGATGMERKPSLTAVGFGSQAGAISPYRKSVRAVQFRH